MHRRKPWIGINKNYCLNIVRRLAVSLQTSEECFRQGHLIRRKTKLIWVWSKANNSMNQVEITPSGLELRKFRVLKNFLWESTAEKKSRVLREILFQDSKFSQHSSLREKLFKTRHFFCTRLILNICSSRNSSQYLSSEKISSREEFFSETRILRKSRVFKKNLSSRLQIFSLVSM